MKNKIFSWNFWSIVIIISYAAWPIARWAKLPQHIDIYYHLLTAWGFIKAGGYTTWDFWQYAPIGRPNIYPPLFHIILAMFMKAGIGKIFLARLFSVALPALFLFTLWSCNDIYTEDTILNIPRTKFFQVSRDEAGKWIAGNANLIMPAI